MSLTHGGVTTPIPANDPNYTIIAGNSTISGEVRETWSVEPTSGSLDPADLWAITIDMGTIVPRLTYTTASSGAVARHLNTSTHRYSVSISGHPTRSGVNNCDQSLWPWSCKYTSTDDRITFAGTVDDFGQWQDVHQRNDAYGMDSFSNVEAQDVPPQFLGSGTVDSPLRILVDLANSYRWMSTAIVHGFYDIDIPSAFIKDMGIDDPSSMTAQSVAGTTGSGTVTVHPDTSTLHVSFADIVFPHPAAGGLAMASYHPRARHNSTRQVAVRRGVVTPTRVSLLTARRTTAHRARIAFHRATPRGSRITGYQARCSAPNHPSKFGTATGSPVIVTDLAAGVRYACTARAKSRAGFGRWATARTITRLP